MLISLSQARAFLLDSLAVVFVIFAAMNTASGQTLGTPPNLVPDSYDADNQVGYCIDSGGSGSCTANDFLITSIDIFNVDDGCSSPEDYMQVDAEVFFNKATPQRYDITAWFYRGDDQAVVPNPDFITQNARIGDFCTRVSLEDGLTITREVAPFDIVGVSGDADSDSCPDVPNTPNGNLQQIVENLVLPCRDIGTPDPDDPQGAPLSTTPDGIVDISGCTSWDNNANSICDGPQYDGVNEPAAGTGSKCNCGEFSGITLQVGLPDIEVTKSCAPTLLSPGGTTTCTIEIINNGTGAQVGALAAGQEGFFYEDDYPEGFGLMPVAISNVTTTQGNTSDGFVSNSDGTLSSNRSLNIYPGDILAGTTVTVMYDFTTDPNLPSDSLTDIENTVCASYFDIGEDGSTEVFSYAFDPDLCASAVVTTPVTLAEVNVAAEAGGYQVDWTTETETSNVGFNIYGRRGSTLFRLNSEIIPSKVFSSLDPTVYSVWVGSRGNEEIKQFYLEDIDSQGTPTKHGPYKLGHGKRSDDLTVSGSRKTNWSEVKRSLSAGLSSPGKSKARKGSVKQSVKGKKSLTNGGYSATVSFTMNAPGVYRAYFDELAALGVRTSELTKGAFLLTDPDGVAVPVRVVAEKRKARGFIEYYADVAKSFYSSENVYLLKTGLGAKSAETVSIAKEDRIRSNDFSPYYLHEEVVDTDSIYVFTSRVEDDPWMMRELFAYGQPASYSVDVPVSSVFDGSAEYSVVSSELVGGVDFNESPDRRLELRVEEALLDSKTSDGPVVSVLEGEFYLDSGVEEVAVELQTVPTNSFNIDVSYLNLVKLVYPRKYVAIDGRLSFKASSSNFKVTGFSSSLVHVYHVAESGHEYVGGFPVSAGGEVTFSGSKTQGKYHLVGEQSIAAAPMEAVDIRDLESIEADHLVIAHPMFAGSELDDYLSRRDLMTAGESAVVTTSQIYAQYSGGVRDAEAIKRFIIEYAARRSLKSVMLVGGDVYDYHDNLGLGAISFVPTLYRATDDLIRFSPVDALFGDTNLDGFPDIPVGRLPVRTVAELVTLLQKSETYTEQQGKTSAVLAADGLRERNPYNFTESSEAVALILEDQGWDVDRAYVDRLGVAQTRTQLLEGLNAGPRLALYSGHSSAGVWSADRLFAFGDTQRLANQGNPSAYLQWGCYNTYFSSPTSDSMSHGLMLAGQQGAALVIGSSTLTNAYAEKDFAVLIQRELINGSDSMGAAMINAKQQYAEQVGLRQKDILWGVTLLGDPLLQL